MAFKTFRKITDILLINIPKLSVINFVCLGKSHKNRGIFIFFAIYTVQWTFLSIQSAFVPRSTKQGIFSHTTGSLRHKCYIYIRALSVYEALLDYS